MPASMIRHGMFLGGGALSGQVKPGVLHKAFPGNPAAVHITLGHGVGV